MSKSTILIESKTRDQLKQIGRKGQTYDQILRELVILKNNSTNEESDSELRGLQAGGR